MKVFARRPNVTIVLGILCLTGLLALRPSLRYLAAERSHTARITADSLAPAPQVSPPLRDGEPLRAANQRAATQALLMILQSGAARQGLLIENLRPQNDDLPDLATVDVSVSGDPRHVLQFAEAMESQSPLIRFASWRLTRVDGRLRLNARANCLWLNGRG